MTPVTEKPGCKTGYITGYPVIKPDIRKKNRVSGKNAEVAGPEVGTGFFLATDPGFSIADPGFCIADPGFSKAYP